MHLKVALMTNPEADAMHLEVVLMTRLVAQVMDLEVVLKTLIEVKAVVGQEDKATPSPLEVSGR